MVKIVVGHTGTGKTKQMIKMANEEAKESHGHVVFIDDDNRNMFELNHQVRFINLDEYNIHSIEVFYGFICGLVSGNYDIQTIYVDGLDYLSHMDQEYMERVLNRFDAVGLKNDIAFIFCFNANPEELSEKTRERILKQS